MMKFSPAVFPALYLALCFGYSIGAEPRNSSTDDLFRRLDVDRDGQISAKEFQLLHALEKQKPAAAAKKSAESRKKSTKTAKSVAKHAKPGLPSKPSAKASTARRSPKNVSIDYPEFDDQVVDIVGGSLFVECSSNPTPVFCPGAFDYQISLWAKTFAEGETLPGQNSDPEDFNAILLGEDTLSANGDVPAAAYGEQHPLPMMTLVVWEKYEYLDINDEIIEDCTHSISKPLEIYGHDSR